MREHFLHHLETHAKAIRPPLGCKKLAKKTSFLFFCYNKSCLEMSSCANFQFCKYPRQIQAQIWALQICIYFKNKLFRKCMMSLQKGKEWSYSRLVDLRLYMFSACQFLQKSTVARGSRTG